MTLVATASFVAFGGIDSIIEHTVVVSPNKAKNKAFRMEAGSAVCYLYLTPESPWAIRDSRITGRDDKTLWKKFDKAHYFMVYGFAENEYVKIDGDLYRSGNGGGGTGTPEYPPFSVTVPKVDLQWDAKHGDASKEEKEDTVPAVLVVSNEGSDFGELIVKAPKDDFSMPSINPKVTLTWDKGKAVRVFDGESEVKSGVTFMLMWGTEKHLSVRAIAAADKVKFTLEGEPDVVNRDRAVDYVYACCAKVKSVCLAKPEGWDEIESTRVLLDDEKFKVKIRIEPQIASLELCKTVFGDSIRVTTSGTAPNGVDLPLDKDAQLVPGNNGECEIHLQKCYGQLRALGIIPACDEDGVNEMAWIDMASPDPDSKQDISDSLAFEGIGYADRGRSHDSGNKDLDSKPPVSAPSKSYFKAAGREIVELFYGGVRSRKRQIMNQADVFYFSGHGSHRKNLIQGGFTPAMAREYWDRDLAVAIIAACSVLDINDYNGNYSGDDHELSPGKAWEMSGPSILLGYAHIAPGDAGGVPTRIVNQWRANRMANGDVDAWMDANESNNAWNACAIVKGQRFVYFKQDWFGLVKTKTVVQKGDW